jgi:hypothetical protein
MSKLRMFGLMLVAMCALGASFVASASAEAPGKFLVNNLVPNAAVEAHTEGELLFESLKTANSTFLCSGIFDGTIAAGGELYEVTKVLNLAGVEVTESDTIALIECEPDLEPNSICSLAAVSPVGLPWDSVVDLVTETDFLLLTLANAAGLLPGYLLLCEVIGIDATELCELLEGTSQLVENGPTDVVFPVATSPTPDAHCTSDGAAEESGGLVVDEALMFVSGTTLAISE